MLDIKFIKDNKDIVEAAVKNKNRQVNIDELLKTFDLRKDLRKQLDDLNTERNLAAKNRDIKKGIELKKQAEDLEAKYNKTDKDFVSFMIKVPNIPSVDTPVGPDESGNVVIRNWGEKPKFDFEPKEHFDVAGALGLLDTETAAKISGSRFAYIKGDLAMMQFALIQHCLNILTNNDTLEKIATDAGLSINTKSFIPIIPPVFIRPAVQNRMARYMAPEDHYLFPDDDLMLIGSAEHTLGPIHMDSIIEEKDLPIRYAGYSTAFRREAGTYGKDTRGILRQHQFDKLEMESFALPEQALNEQNFLVAIQEHILQTLKLPYEVMLVCTGDMGFPDTRQIDINTWMPGQNTYRETHSADYTSSFQSRRLNTRVRRADGTLEPLHMNDATVVAIGRTLIAIIENYQQADGSIKVPEVLQKYLGKEFIK